MCLCKDTKEEKDMATLEITNTYFINNQEAELIANTPKTKVPKPSYANGFHMSSKEQDQKALEVLSKWKNRH